MVGKIAEYSKLVYEYKSSESSDAKLKAQIDRIVTEIPAEVLNAFWPPAKKSSRKYAVHRVCFAQYI